MAYGATLQTTGGTGRGQPRLELFLADAGFSHPRNRVKERLRTSGYF